MQLQLTLTLVPHLTVEEISAFEEKCKRISTAPEEIVAGLIRRDLQKPTRPRGGNQQKGDSI